MPIGCLICDEPLESPSPVVPDPPPSLVTGAGTKAKKPKCPKRPPATVNDNVVTPCGHMFHELCIVQWFKNKSSTTCPVCRKALTKAKLNRVFPSVVEEDTEPAAACNTDTNVLANKRPSPVKKTKSSGNASQGATPVPSDVPSSSGTQRNSSNSGSLTGVIKWAPNGKWSYQPGALQSFEMSYKSHPDAMIQSSASQSHSSSVFSNQNFQYQSVSNSMNTTAQNTASSSYSSYYRDHNLYHGPKGLLPAPTSQTLQGNAPPNSDFIQPYVNLNYLSQRATPYYPSYTLPSYLPPPPATQSTTHPLARVTNTNPGTVSGSSTTVGGPSSTSSSSIPSSSQPLSSIASTSTPANQVPTSGTAPTAPSCKITIKPAVEISRNHSSTSTGFGSGQYRPTNNMDLNNHRYDELNVIHQTLVADYNELQQKYNDSKDEVQLLKAQLESSKDEIKRLQEHTKTSQSVTHQTSSNHQTKPSPSTTSVAAAPVAPKRSHDGMHVTSGPASSTRSAASAGCSASSVNAPPFNYLASHSMINSQGPWTFYNLPYLPRLQPPPLPTPSITGQRRQPTTDAQSRVHASSPPTPV